MLHPHLSYLEAILVGLLQGVTELFPVSSLGHSILIPALIGGNWARDLNMSAKDSPYLTFLVAVHVATAVALVVFFRREWMRIAVGLVTSIRDRRICTPDQRLAWLLIAATIPVGVTGLVLEHAVRTVLGKPAPAAIFLILNGAVLAGVERLRARATPKPAASYTGPVLLGTGINTGGASAAAYVATGYQDAPSAASTSGSVSAMHSEAADAAASDQRLAGLSWKQAILIGAAQVLALLPGISRSGSTIAAGLLRGLNHEDAARFAFLLATPVILAAGVLKLPELAGPAGHGILGPVAAGSVAAGIAAYISLKFLTRYFQTRTLNPFALYCVAAGTVSLAVITLT